MMEWKKTTLRRGTKSPRICRDMFITDSCGKFLLCEVKNGKSHERLVISEATAKDIIKKYMLVKSGSCFAQCFTYRDFASTKLVRDLLK